jgi:enamine deaminase RidA (YjgF/YER057c/UK114 family)
MRACALGALLLLACVSSHAQERGVTMGRPIVAAYPDGFVVTSHVLPSTGDGRIAGGGIGGQTRQALQNLDASLKARGSSLARAASIHVYLRNAADFAEMNRAYAEFFAVDPPVRTTIVADLVAKDALIQVAAVALPPGAPREVVHPPGWTKSPNPYSYGIRSGDVLFLAGLVARRGQDNAIVEGDVATQTKAVLDNAEAILAAAGMGFADVVSSRVFITDVATFQEMNAAYRVRFPEPRPVRATVACALMNPAFTVEITLVADRRAKTAVTTPRPDGTAGTPGPNFSSALRVGERLYLSGFLGSNESNRGDIEAQTREALATARRTLQAAGATWADVVEAVVYVTDVSKAAGVATELSLAIGRAEVPIVAAGTGLVAPDGLVEVVLTARAPRAR